MSQYGPPENPYGQPQLPPPQQQQQYGQQYAPQQQPTAPAHGHQYATPARSQGLAITALVFGVVALVAALWVVSRGVAPFIGVAALILSIIALVNKRQGGKALAAGGLALGMVSIPLAIILWVVAAGQEVANNKQVQQMSDCIENQPDDILACSGLD